MRRRSSLLCLCRISLSLRFMNIHEFQAKDILKRFGVAVPRGIVASTPEAAKAAALELGGAVCVVKAQIHAGGRGKGGGVKVVKSPDEAAESARQTCSAKISSPIKPARRGARCAACWSSRGSTSRASFISPWCSTAPSRA